jgi:hypothetical protein
MIIKGIIIGGWKPNEFPLEGGETIQVYARPASTAPPDPAKGETHWISVEEHRKIMRIYENYVLDEVARAERNRVAELLGRPLRTGRDFEIDFS